MLRNIRITMILAMIGLPHAHWGSQSIPWGARDLKISQAPKVIFSLSRTLIFLTFSTFVRDPLTESKMLSFWRVRLSSEKLMFTVFFAIVAYPALQKGYVYCVFCNCCIPMN